MHDDARVSADDGSPRWEHFSHDADIGVRGVGPTLAAAFEQAAIALTGVVTNPDRVAAAESVEIRCAADEDDLLLLDWLNAIVYEMATRRMLFSRFEVAIDDRELRAVAWGERVDAARHEPAAEVKGATFTALSVRSPAPGHWVVEDVVDV